MSETDDLQQVGEELSRAARTVAIAVVEGTRLVEQRKLVRLQKERDALRSQEQLIRDHRKELLQGAPTQHQQRNWQNQIGAGDSVAVKIYDDVYTGTVQTNPNKQGDMSIKFDDPRVTQTVGDVWHREEAIVRKQGNPEQKMAAAEQPQRAKSEQEQKWQTEAAQKASTTPDKSTQQSWQKQLGRGDTVRAKDRGNTGTVTTDPKNGEVTVHFYNKKTGTERERSFNVDQLQVTKPANQTIKTEGKPFTVAGPDAITRTVTNGPAIPDTKTPKTEPTKTRRPPKPEANASGNSRTAKPEPSKKLIAEARAKLGAAPTAQPSTAKTPTTQPKSRPGLEK